MRLEKRLGREGVIIEVVIPGEESTIHADVRSVEKRQRCRNRSGGQKHPSGPCKWTPNTSLVLRTSPGS